MLGRTFRDSLVDFLPSLKEGEEVNRSLEDEDIEDAKFSLSRGQG